MSVQTIKENVVALLLAALIAFVIMFFVSNTEFMQADIAWVEQEEQQDLWELIANYSEEEVYVESNINVDDVSSISLQFDFDRNKMNLETLQDIVDDQEYDDLDSFASVDEAMDELEISYRDLISYDSEFEEISLTMTADNVFRVIISDVWELNEGDKLISVESESIWLDKEDIMFSFDRVMYSDQEWERWWAITNKY